LGKLFRKKTYAELECNTHGNEIRDRKHTTIIHQLEHTETVIKSKYENNIYWLGKYYLKYFKRQLMTKQVNHGL